MYIYIFSAARRAEKRGRPGRRGGDEGLSARSLHRLSSEVNRSVHSWLQGRGGGHRVLKDQPGRTIFALRRTVPPRPLPPNCSPLPAPGRWRALFLPDQPLSTKLPAVLGLFLGLSRNCRPLSPTTTLTLQSLGFPAPRSANSFCVFSKLLCL